MEPDIISNWPCQPQHSRHSLYCCAMCWEGGRGIYPETRTKFSSASLIQSPSLTPAVTVSEALGAIVRGQRREIEVSTAGQTENKMVPSRPLLIFPSTTEEGEGINNTLHWADDEWSRGSERPYIQEGEEGERKQRKGIPEQAQVSVSESSNPLIMNGPALVHMGYLGLSWVILDLQARQTLLNVMVGYSLQSKVSRLAFLWWLMFI